MMSIEEMLASLQRLGWEITLDDNDGLVFTFSNCFDNGIFAYTYVMTNAAFKDRKARDPYFTDQHNVTDEPFVVASESLHRITESFLSTNGAADTQQAAVKIAYLHCLDWHARLEVCKK